MLSWSVKAITSSVSLDKGSYESNERILGNITIILNDGDFIPENTSIAITTNAFTTTLSLLQFMILSSNHNFDYTNSSFTNVDGNNTFENQSGYGYRKVSQQVGEYTISLSKFFITSPDEEGNYNIELIAIYDLTEEIITTSSESYAVNNIPITSLTIVSSSPLGHIKTTSPKLEVKTGGDAVCKYSDGDETYDTMSLYLDSTDYRSHHSRVLSLSDGEYDYYVRCKNSGGGEADVKINFKVDTKKPIITLHNPVHLETITFWERVIFKYTPKDESGLDNCELSLYSDDDFDSVSTNDIQSDQSQYFKLIKLLKEGEYKWSISCTDTAGNSVSSVERSFTISKMYNENFNYAGINDSRIQTIIRYVCSNGSIVSDSDDCTIETSNESIAKTKNATKGGKQSNNLITGLFISPIRGKFNKINSMQTWIAIIWIAVVIIIIIILLNLWKIFKSRNRDGKQKSIKEIPDKKIKKQSRLPQEGDVKKKKIKQDYKMLRKKYDLDTREPKGG